jgi:hypothetical protein
MRTAVMAGGLVLMLLAGRVGGAETGGLARGMAERLMARKSLRPETHATDFAGDTLGCITLTAAELRRFGYPGHAFFCENAATGEVLGAVLGRYGRVYCSISGDYAGDGCYDFTLCDVPDSACVR